MKSDRNKILGNNIRAERNRKGYSQEKLAELVDMHNISISQIELGKQSPSIFAVIDIAKVLEIDISKLLEDII